MAVWRPAPFAGLRRFARGASLVRADEPAHTVYLLRRGEVRLYLLTEDGRETTTAVIGPGQVVGISALLGRPIYHGFAEALVATEAWSLPADRLLRHLPTDRVLLGLLVGALARRLAQEVSLVGEVALLPVGQRLADLQARLTSELGHQPRLNKRALAELIGARPETLSRAGGQLRARSHRTAQVAAAGSRRAPAWPTSEASRSSAPAAKRSPADLLALVRGEPAQTFMAGESIPDGSDRVHVVQEGLVRLYVTGPHGREVTIDVVEAGQCYGLASAPEPALRAQAASDARVCSIEQRELPRLLDRYPGAALEIARQLAARLLRVERCLRRVEAPNARIRLAALLHDLAREIGEPEPRGGRRLPTGWTHDALARQIGYRRETVSRALRSLAEHGYVRQMGRRLVVVEPERMREDFGLEAAPMSH
jgi:CRP/FNR family transcriptional regulator, cyclic AMP receptor protein